MSAPTTAATQRRVGVVGRFEVIRAALPSGDAVVGVLPPVLIGLAAMTFIWSRFILLNQGLWGDEAFSVVRYIGGGPSAIWDASRWVPNDHMLFEFMTWATTGILGIHTEATYRLWSVFPALAAAILMTWWLWNRAGRWTAAIFAVLATATPIYLDLGTQARGYGIGFLAGALIVVAADRVLVAADRAPVTESRAPMIGFAVGGFIGMATLENFVAAFLAAAAVMLLAPALRRRTITTVVWVGVATVAWYGPVLTQVLFHQNPFGTRLPWYGFVTAPLRDLLGAGIHALAPGVSVTAGAIIAAGVIAVGAVGLWRRRERRLLLLLVTPVLLTYLLLEVAAKYAPRFGSFVLLPLLALVATGLTTAERALARARWSGALALVLVTILSLATLDRFAQYAAAFAQVPFEASKSAGQIIRGIRGTGATVPIFSNTRNGGAFGQYVLPQRIVPGSSETLVNIFCTDPGRFVYLEQGLAQRPPTACLTRRGGFRIFLPERRSQVWVWLVPSLPRGAAP